MSIEVRDNRENPWIRTRLVLGLVGGFLLMVAVAMWSLHGFYRARLASTNVQISLGAFPIPQIQPNPREDLQKFRRQQNEQLAGYAWVDKTKGLVHVPIDRAMDFVVSRGAAALDPIDQPGAAQSVGGGGPPDGSPRATATMPASPYGLRP